MKSLTILAALLLLSSYLEAKGTESRRSIRGSVEAEKGIKEGGELYVSIAPLGGSSIAIEQPGAKKEAVPSESVRFISLGKFYGRAKDFSFLLKKGSYQISCIVKRSDPPCKEITRNGEKRIVSCIPTKDDFVCAGITLEVMDQDLDAIKIQLGLPDKGDS